MKIVKLFLNIFEKYRLGLILSLLAIVFWIYYTLTSEYYALQEYNTDELWAWDIAADLNLIEIIKLMRYEQHTFLWYFVLKPFTYFDNLYPYVIKYLNWIFSLGFVCIFHIFAPINRLLKILITLTLPILIIYPSEARFYSLGIFLLFILTSLYKKRIEHPVWFSILVFLTANSSLMTAVIAVPIGLIFVFDIIKKYKDINKKENTFKNLLLKKHLPIFLIIFTLISLYVQWCNPEVPFWMSFDYIENARKTLVYDFYFRYKYSLLNYLSYIVFLIIVPFTVLINIIKEKRSSLRWIIIAGTSIITLNLIFILFYTGAYYHLFHIYIFIIVLYWLKIEDEITFKKGSISYKSYTIMLFLISLLFLYPLKEVPTNFWYKKVYTDCVQQIKEIVPKNSKIYVVLELGQGLIPYLKKDYDLRDIEEYKIPSFDAYKNIDQTIYRNIHLNLYDRMPFKFTNESDRNEYFLVSSWFLQLPLYFSPENIINLKSDDISYFSLCKIPPPTHTLKILYRLIKMFHCAFVACFVYHFFFL